MLMTKPWMSNPTCGNCKKEIVKPSHTEACYGKHHQCLKKQARMLAEINAND